MGACLLDTDVVSFLFKGDPRGKKLVKGVEGLTPCISFVTLAELYRWPILKGWGSTQIEALEREVASYRILPSSLRLCRKWADVASIKGHPMNHHDAWIAATALVHSIPLITNNKSDFLYVPGLNLIADP